MKLVDINTVNIIGSIKYMNPMKALKTNIRMEKVFVYLKDLTVENLIFTAALCLLVLLLTGSIVRVISNARSNYEIFAIESNSLNELNQKNLELQKELEYVTSDEYKILLLRNASNLAQSQEELYTIRDKPTYLDEKVTLLSSDNKDLYKMWWEILLSHLI